MTGARRGERPPVLEMKLRAPRMPATNVTRKQLLREIAAADEAGRTATLVTASAGAGKTMLLTQRFDELRSAGAPVAWLSLDDGDDDPSPFWSGILGACAQALHFKYGSVPLALESLLLPVGAARAEFLAAWHEAIEPRDELLWLIIDDVHELNDREVVGDLAQLLRTAPPWLRLVLGSRHDMPLPIPRMLVAGTAGEIRSADLAFTWDEARELLSGHGVELTDRDLGLLLASTEGWAAGLKLAALSLRARDDVSSFIAELAGDERPVADYLVHEVLARQATDVREFLLTTAIPEQVTVELADTLTGRADAGAVLDQLAHDNVFTYRQDFSPPTYRYHPLFRSYLLAELNNNDARGVRTLHARASDWFAAHGAPAKAINHSVAAGDWAKTAGLVDEYGLRLILSGDTVPVERALAAAPNDVLADPRVCLIAAVLALQSGHAAVAERHLSRVGEDPTRHADSRLRLLHTAVLLQLARLRGERSSRVEAWVEQSQSHLIDDHDLQLLAVANRGMTLGVLGDFTAADSDLSAALRLAHAQQRDWMVLECLSQLALTAAALGDVPRMVTRAQQAIDFATARGWVQSSPMVRSYLFAAWGSWHAMDVDAPEALVSRAASIESDVEPPVALSVRILRAYAQFTRTGDRAGLVHEVRAAWADTVPARVDPMAVSQYCVADLRTALSTGDKGWADETVVRARQLLGDDSGDVAVLRSLVSAHRGRNAPARSELAPVLTGDRPCYGASALIVAWLLEAELADANDEPARAHDAVLRALELTAPPRRFRDLVTASEAVRQLLLRGRGRFGPHEDFVGEVLSAAHAADDRRPSVGAVDLTARELDILRDLQSPHAVDEIAVSQAVSVNTVKTHLKALYRKLGARSRREAVDRGRELGLL